MATKPTGHGFEYFRHGTLSLYAALNTRTGDLIGKTTARHTSAEFVDFLGQIVASQPDGREILQSGRGSRKHFSSDNFKPHPFRNDLFFVDGRPSTGLAGLAVDW